MKCTGRTSVALMLLALMVVAHAAPLRAMAAPSRSASRKLLDNSDKNKAFKNLVAALQGGKVQAAAQTAQTAAPADVANAALTAANSGSGKSSSARAFNQLAKANRARASAVWAQLLSQSRRTNKVGQASDIFRTALLEAKKNGELKPVATSMAQGIADGGAASQQTAADAFAKAVAGGADQQQALAEATASVACSGQGSLATAWSTAFSIALTKDSRGCLVLNQAQAIAIAQCQGGFFGKPGSVSATSSNTATSTLLGFCGLLKNFPGVSFSNTQSNANTQTLFPGFGSATANANGTASTFGGNQAGGASGRNSNAASDFISQSISNMFRNAGVPSGK